MPTLEVIDLSKVHAPPARRSRGMAIAIALLALMVLFGAWYVWRTMNKVAPDPAATEAPVAASL